LCKGSPRDAPHLVGEPVREQLLGHGQCRLVQWVVAWFSAAASVQVRAPRIYISASDYVYVVLYIQYGVSYRDVLCVCVCGCVCVCVSVCLCVCDWDTRTPLVHPSIDHSLGSPGALHTTRERFPPCKTRHTYTGKPPC
jgi:hypothetical protein